MIAYLGTLAQRKTHVWLLCGNRAKILPKMMTLTSLAPPTLPLRDAGVWPTRARRAATLATATTTMTIAGA